MSVVKDQFFDDKRNAAAGAHERIKELLASGVSLDETLDELVRIARRPCRNAIFEVLPERVDGDVINGDGLVVIRRGPARSDLRPALSRRFVLGQRGAG